MQRAQINIPQVDIIYESNYNREAWGDLKPATDGSAGYDLVACIDKPITIEPGQTVMVSAGFRLHIKTPGIAAYLYPRSGKGAGKGLVLANLTGIVDSDYQGIVKIALWNRVDVDANRMLGLLDGVEPKPEMKHWLQPDVVGKSITIEPGEAVAQLIFGPVVHPVLNAVESFEETTARGDGGFGSTKK